MLITIMMMAERPSRVVEGLDTLLRVECYAGHRGEETPRVLTMGDRRVVIDDVLDRWLAPDHRYFKVKGDDGDVYIVRQDTNFGAWELTMFRRGE